MGFRRVTQKAWTKMGQNAICGVRAYNWSNTAKVGGEGVRWSAAQKQQQAQASSKKQHKQQPRQSEGQEVWVLKVGGGASSRGISVGLEAFFFKQNLQQLVIDFFRSLMEGKSIVKLFLTFGKSRRGFTRQPENSKRARLSRPSITPPKFHETTPKRGRKNENCGGRGKKKSEILGCPAEGRSGGEGVRGSAQILDTPTKILNTHRHTRHNDTTTQRHNDTTTQHNNTTQHNTTQHNTTQHNTTQHNNDTPHNTTGDPAQGGLGQGEVLRREVHGPKNKT